MKTDCSTVQKMKFNLVLLLLFFLFIVSCQDKYVVNDIKNDNIEHIQQTNDSTGYAQSKKVIDCISNLNSKDSSYCSFINNYGKILSLQRNECFFEFNVSCGIIAYTRIKKDTIFVYWMNDIDCIHAVNKRLRRIKLNSLFCKMYAKNDTILKVEYLNKKLINRINKEERDTLFFDEYKLNFWKSN